MSNPWLTQNQYMSFWLSCFNQMTGHCASQPEPQIDIAAIKAVQKNLKLLNTTSKPSPGKAKAKTKPRSKR